MAAVESQTRNDLNNLKIKDMSKNLKWEDVYNLPLELIGGYCYSKNNTMSLTFDYNVLSKEQMKRITDCINGDIDEKISNLTKDGCDFFINGTYVFCVRGWGKLTGAGGLNLAEDKAILIQDGFIDFVFNKLSA